MVSIIKRTRRLRTLLSIRTGPGAAKLPPEISRLHLDFAQKNDNGHMGARKFWRHCLPRLKYHNPAVVMTLNRSVENSAEPTLSIFYTSPDSKSSNIPISAPSETSSSPPSSQNLNTSDQTLSLRNKTDSDILKELLRLTGAIEVRPSQDDVELAAQLKETMERSEEDSRQMLLINRARKREEDLLKQARGEVA